MANTSLQSGSKSNQLVTVDGQPIETRSTIIAPLDVGGSVETIDFAHHEIHEGNSFKATVSGTIATSANVNISFTTGDNYLHVKALANATGAATYAILEAPTITAGTGTNVLIYNRNRNSSKTSQIKSMAATPVVNYFTRNATITADGTNIYSELIGSGKNKQSGDSRSDLEWILKPSTTYSYRILSQANGNVINLILVWYEVG